MFGKRRGDLEGRRDWLFFPPINTGVLDPPDARPPASITSLALVRTEIKEQGLSAKNNVKSENYNLIVLQVLFGSSHLSDAKPSSPEEFFQTCR